MLLPPCVVMECPTPFPCVSMLGSGGLYLQPDHVSRVPRHGHVTILYLRCCCLLRREPANPISEPRELSRGCREHFARVGNVILDCLPTSPSSLNLLRWEAGRITLKAGTTTFSWLSSGLRRKSDKRKKTKKRKRKRRKQCSAVFGFVCSVF